MADTLAYDAGVAYNASYYHYRGNLVPLVYATPGYAYDAVGIDYWGDTWPNYSPQPATRRDWDYWLAPTEWLTGGGWWQQRPMPLSPFAPTGSKPYPAGMAPRPATNQSWAFWPTDQPDSRFYLHPGFKVFNEVGAFGTVTYEASGGPTLVYEASGTTGPVATS